MTKPPSESPATNCCVAGKLRRSIACYPVGERSRERTITIVLCDPSDNTSKSVELDKDAAARLGHTLLMAATSDTWLADALEEKNAL